MTNKPNRRKFRKLFILFAVIFITAVVLVYETYAWFVGITNVNVNQFQITVTGAQGLELSLNGSQWVTGDTALTISEANIESTAAGNASQAYQDNTNKWPDNGLKPVSGGGFASGAVGRMEFFDKESLSATGGGYRIVAKKIDNYTITNGNLVPEADGYIAFDLFVRNGVDDIYDSSLSLSGFENIYLTSSSNVTVSGTNHGAANSIRVGFYEIGYMKAKNADVSTLRGINCNSSTGGVVSRCNNITAAVNIADYWNVWEPNHNVHTQDLVDYFNAICKKRDTTTGEYTSTACNTLTTTTFKKTYRIIKEIDADKGVDVYDGAEVNGYSLTSTSAPNIYLQPLVTYKTPTNANSYTHNNQLIKLPGNSVSKIRVYIWLEGQDIDNYDVISGDTIRINFGLTKDRYNVENT